ncbi:5341_t:CDS:2, partial [Cetraspora pellucida]
ISDPLSEKAMSTKCLKLKKKLPHLKYTTSSIKSGVSSYSESIDSRVMSLSESFKFITSSNSSCSFMNDRAIDLENRVQRLKELLRNKDEQLNQQAEMITQLSKMLNSKFKKRTRNLETCKTYKINKSDIIKFIRVIYDMYLMLYLSAQMFRINLDDFIIEITVHKFLTACDKISLVYVYKDG